MASFRFSLVWHDKSASGSAKERLPDLKGLGHSGELEGVRESPATAARC